METPKFISPIDGDILNIYDAARDAEGTYIFARISAPQNMNICVNGINALCDGYEEYLVALPVTEGKNRLRLTCGSYCEDIHVYFRPDLCKLFRISSDDNILFLRNINRNKDKYSSIFDDPYLSIYKKAHDLYGACVDLNLFYETDDMPGFYEKGEYFNLSMMTDKFKSEWEKNSDWLRLSFHANAEHPARPYLNSSYEELYADAKKVNGEIVRFAGESSLSSTATVHWGNATKEGTLAMKDLGYKTLAGYFELSDNNKPRVAYYYDPELIRHIGERDLWLNHETGILHSKIDLVLNTVKYNDLTNAFSKLFDNLHATGIVEIMIHEQYFYPEYKNYIPEFEKLIMESAELLYSINYRGSFIENIYS